MKTLGTSIHPTEVKDAPSSAAGQAPQEIPAAIPLPQELSAPASASEEVTGPVEIIDQPQTANDKKLNINDIQLLSPDSESDSLDTDEGSDTTSEIFYDENESGTPSESKFKQDLRVWAANGITGAKVSELLRILHPLHKELPLTAKTLLKTEHNLHSLIKVFNGNEADYRPFTISAYCGRGKPDPIDEYMGGLINELDHLCEHGIVIDHELFEVQVKYIICDRPARSAFKCVSNHGAYFACERCWVIGFSYIDRIFYPFRNDKERTDVSFKNVEDHLHHTSVSPLTKLKKPLNLVLLFILDIMHLNYQGEMKKLLKMWFSSDSKLCKEKLLRISMRLVKLKTQIPSEFQRSTRTLEDVSKWTAHEFREILLYTGPFVSEGILDEAEYKHFLLLHVGTRILCSSELYKKYTPCVKVYLQRFSMLTGTVYGLEFASLTNHFLAHLADDVENIDCPASFFTAFPNENDLGDYKRFIKSGNRPLEHICTKVERDLEFNFKKAVISPELQILKYKEVDNLFHIQKLEFKNGSIIEIKSMVSSSMPVDPTKLFILGEQLKILGPAFTYPTCSSLLKQKVEAQQKQGCGCWYVLYPDPPFEEDDKDMIQGFVEDPSSIPPVAWTEKKCMVQGLADSKKKQAPKRRSLKETSPAKPVIPKKPKTISRKQELIRQKKAGLGQILQPLAEAVQNLCAPIDPSTAPVTHNSDSLSLTSTSQENDIFLNQNNISEVPNHSSNTAMPRGHETISQPAEEDLQKVLFDTPSIEDILRRSAPSENVDFIPPDDQNTLFVDHQAQAHAQDNASNPLMRIMNAALINCDRLEGKNSESSIVSQMKAHITETASQVKAHITETVQVSKKKIMAHVDVKMKEIKIMFRNKNKEIANVITFDNVKSKHPEFTSPIANCDKFTTFNEKIEKDDNNISQDLRTHIMTTTSSKMDAKDNLDTILKNLIDNQVLASHTASQSTSNEKPVFKHTAFLKVMRDVLFCIHNTQTEPDKLTETIILRLVGKIINSRRSSGYEGEQVPVDNNAKNKKDMY
ncbi:hypothetical protein QAD02_005431 [Eretmocerus hayati]|uniref:Uncharacterized protein n=1 Tax=Eretmocerus hayati TaxID=131215 RepID=A0ACC2NSG0_9HYME|nr:hypothetical protein QAD02_005431 [Eretmocerus hayati]